MITKKSQRGFTIMELMIATMVFGVLLLMSMAAFIHIGRLFYKAVVTARTEEVARTVIEDITAEVRRSSSSPTPGFIMVGAQRVDYVCIQGQTEYFYIPMRQFKGDPDDTLNAKRFGLRKAENVGNCGQVSDFPNGTKQLLGEYMRVSDFSITDCSAVVPCSGKLSFIHLRLSYGDKDVFTTDADTNSNPKCKGSPADSQFCVVTELNTGALRR